jgi:hypothetical protein
LWTLRQESTFEACSRKLFASFKLPIKLLERCFVPFHSKREVE